MSGDAVGAPRGGGAPTESAPTESAPTARRIDARVLARAVVVVALVAGSVVVLAKRVPALASLGGAAAAATVGLAVVTAAVLGVLVRRVDRPRLVTGWGAALAVLWGAAVCIPLAALINSGSDRLMASWWTAAGTRAWGPVLVTPVTEETLKALVVVVAAVTLPGGLRSPKQAMVLGALTGAAFEVVENLDYAVAAGRHDRLGALRGVLASEQVRAIPGALGAHWVLSAFTGLAVGLILAGGRRSRRRRYGEAAALVAAALLTHAARNTGLALTPLLGRGPTTTLVSGSVVVAFVGFLVVLAYAARGHARVDLDRPDAVPRWSGGDAAWWSLVCGLVGIAAALAEGVVGPVWLVGVVGVVLGFVAVRRGETRNGARSTAWWGLAGVVAGSVALAVGLLGDVAAVAPIAWP